MTFECTRSHPHEDMDDFCKLHTKVDMLRNEFANIKTKAITDYQVKELAHRVCWKYKKSSDPKHSDTYTFNESTLLEFARLLKLMEKDNDRLSSAS